MLLQFSGAKTFCLEITSKLVENGAFRPEKPLLFFLGDGHRRKNIALPSSAFATPKIAATCLIFMPSLHRRCSKPELNKRTLLPSTQVVRDDNFGDGNFYFVEWISDI